VIDDATAEMVTPSTMPNTFTEIVRPGTKFENFIAVSPLCCPSRANMLTGQYGHNNGVLRNHYSGLKRKGHLLPRWLQLGGYRTMHVGKYLNGFTNSLDEDTQVPWGWDEWFTLIDNGYYDYTVSDNGRLRRYGGEPRDYVTRVLNDKVVELIARQALLPEPFYLQLDHFAPHPRPTRDEETCRSGTIPDPDDLDGVRTRAVTSKTSRNETNVRDKPKFVRRQPRLSSGQLAKARRNYKCAVASLAAVDRGVGSLIRALRQTDQLDDTAIFFTSDNGYFFGEHRIQAKKEFAYEENLRMPLFVRMPAHSPGELRPASSDALVGTIDLAPTFLELGDADSCDERGQCRQMDGRSLLPLLGPGGAEDWPSERALVLELEQKPAGKQRRTRPCSYLGLRTENRTYVEYRSVAEKGEPCRETDDVELYDLERDPEQLRNLSGVREGEERELRRRLRGLEECEGNVTDPDPGPNPCE
jgi:N-acetylglucosamine-6-sulfatase